MVFQKPNPFPKSIYDNIAYGLRINGLRDKRKIEETVERSLREAALWDEVKDRLDENAFALSGGQQQRLCIARALAVEPEVILFDEPCSALDPIATAKVEDLIEQLKRSYTIVIVTHNMQQAARVSDYTAFMMLGELVEFDETERIFTDAGQQADRGLHHRAVRMSRPATWPRGGEMSKTERPFDEELKVLKEKLLEMASRAEEQIATAVRGLKDREEGLACQVLEREEAINLLDIEIDGMGLRLLALRQPLATDLRFITSAMKISSDLERIGDLAVNIAERTLDLLKKPQLKPLIDIPRMAQMAQDMVRDALNAFVEHDDTLARDVCERDDLVDQLNDQIFRELLTYMMQDPGTIARAVDLILVGRHLERIADHATNIAEDVIYMVKGKTIKHHVESGAGSLKAGPNGGAG